MQPFGKRGLTAGAVAVTLGIAAFSGSLATASSALAAAPGGTACNPTNGKINGRGSTYQTNAQAVWWGAYESEICGITAGSPADAAGNNMGVYNYPAAVSASATGSGAGEKATNCRTDAYAGTDIPYTEAQLTALDGAPGNTTQSALTPCTISLTVPPFAPNSTTQSAYPNTGNDIAANLMSFPVAGSSEAVEVNLPSSCSATTSLEFTGSQLSAIMGGNVAMWNSSVLTSNNPSLSSCAVAITRVVRQDNSGTTNIFKQYLIDIDNNRTGATCAPGTTWASYNSAPNTTWPSGTGCSSVVTNASSGGPALLSTLNATSGGIGYADLSDAQNLASSDIQVSMQNATGTQYVAPASGLGANCDYSGLSEPGGGGAKAMVGLSATDNWGSDNATVNGTGQHDDANDVGVQYPICGLTYDLVYSKLSAGPSSPSAITGLSADQRRTLYSYVTFVLSSLGQSLLPNNNYASLPTTWTPAILQGFQGNY